MSGVNYFADAIAHVLAAEGGFSQNTHDHGGATNHGITIQTLSRFRGVDATVDDVRTLSVSEARDIYRAYYWTPLKLDNCVNRQIAIVLFDQSVNRGPYRATVDLQTTLNSLGSELKVDGSLGELTMNAVNATPPELVFKGLFKRAQTAYVSIVTHDHTQLVFLAGWINRTHAFLDL